MRTRFTCVAAAVALGVSSSSAELVSEDGDFGADTVTFDSESGQRWLDLSVSTNRSYADVLGETGAGGDFEGWRHATRDEIATFFEHAGLDLGPPSNAFLTQNHDPAVALAALIGTTGTQGNCGAGCQFSYVQGWRTREAGEDPAYAFSSSIAWFDNTAGLFAAAPATPVGRAILTGYTQDGARVETGSFLVEVPEPGAPEAAAAAVTALVVARLAAGTRARIR